MKVLDELFSGIYYCQIGRKFVRPYRWNGWDHERAAARLSNDSKFVGNFY